MAKLVIEIWERPNSTECAAVSESSDRLRADDAVRIGTFEAETHDEAMSRRNEMLGFGPYHGLPGLTDQPFSEEQAREQQAYLAVRPERWRSGK